MALPRSLAGIASRVEHVRVSVSDVEAARALDDTGELVLSAAPAGHGDADRSTESLARLRERGVPIFPVPRPA